MNTEYNIPSGHSDIPRQIAVFPEFRDELLSAVPRLMSQYGWRARRRDDFGVMLLEMWAYCCDVLSYYDEVIAHECYIRTARRRASLRRLVSLLGYLPRPALAASVRLALIAEGKQPVVLPAGIAFRSSAFSDNPPQIFEMDGPETIYPQNNMNILKKVMSSTFSGGQSFLLLRPEDANIGVGDYVMLLEVNAVRHVTKVTAVNKIQGDDGVAYVRIDLRDAVPVFGTLAVLSNIRLLKTLNKIGQWNLPPVSGNYSVVGDLPKVRPVEHAMSMAIYDQNAVAQGLTSVDVIPAYPAPVQPSSDLIPVEIISQGTDLALNGLVQDLKHGDTVLVEHAQYLCWYTVTNVKVTWKQPFAQEPTVIQDASGVVINTVQPPPVRVPITELTLTTSSEKDIFKAVDAQSDGQITVHYSLHKAGTVVQEASLNLMPGAPMIVSGSEELYSVSGEFILEDANQYGVSIGGTLNAASRVVTPDHGDTYDKPLRAPVKLYGNVVSASRGESVSREVLGSGDASVPNQSFKLKKKPLTYLADNSGNNDLGASSTLKLYVNNALWKEVPSFYSAGRNDNVYIVRHNDDGEAVITCGDGICGARFPTGLDNIVAFYRFGAGAASPPANSITQLAKPVKGIKSVFNAVAAIPGSEAQTSESVRTYAPKSALLLGRAVSVQDFEAAAACVPGVRAAQALWSWNQDRQQPVVNVWVIGPDSNQFREKVHQALHALSDPSTNIDVRSAAGLPKCLSIVVDCDPCQEDRVVTEVRSALLDPETGILAPERIGIGTPLYRSLIFEAVLSVDGADAVTGILWEGRPFTSFSPENPIPGTYYDLENGLLRINGRTSAGRTAQYVRIGHGEELQLMQGRAVNGSEVTGEFIVARKRIANASTNT